MQKFYCKDLYNEYLDFVRNSNFDRSKAMEIITVGNDPASKVYVRGKLKDAAYCNISTIHKNINFEDDSINMRELDMEIEKCNKDDNISGVILQLPLPKSFYERDIADYYVNKISVNKDLDGISNGIYSGDEYITNRRYIPCTPAGVIRILHRTLSSDLTGNNVLIIGRSKLVGKPLADLLLDEDCTVTLAHSKTRTLDSMLDRYDIIVCAVGKKDFLDLKKCKAKIVVDVGINKDENGKICGDCYNYEETGDGMIVTAVPGGVGLMTRASLMMNFMTSAPLKE